MAATLPDIRSVDVGGPVRYREWDGPEGTTFVLIHGLGGSHLNWAQVAPELAGLGRVLAPDLPGFGRSPRVGRGTRLMDLRAALSGFLDAVGAGRVIVARELDGRRASGSSRRRSNPSGSSTASVATSSVYPWARGAVRIRSSWGRSRCTTPPGWANARGRTTPGDRSRGRRQVQPPTADRRPRPDPRGRRPAPAWSCSGRRGTTPTCRGRSWRRRGRS